MDHLSVEMEAAVLDEGSVSMETPSVLTLRLQNGSVRLGGRFFATVTLKREEKFVFIAMEKVHWTLTKWSTGRRVCLIPHRPLEC